MADLIVAHTRRGGVVQWRSLSNLSLQLTFLYRLLGALLRFAFYFPTSGGIAVSVLFKFEWAALTSDYRAAVCRTPLELRLGH